jgi:hypothetical protein
VGAFITNVSLTGENAADFLVTTPGSGDPFLIPVGGARDILLEYIGTAPLSSAMLNVNYNGQQTASVEITGSLFSADFNGDGNVDAADYVVWRKVDGTPQGYDMWRAHFGKSGGRSGIVSTSNTTVPEPASLMLLIFGVNVVGGSLRSRGIASGLPTTSWRVG